MKKYKKYTILLCAVLTLLLAACSADGQKRQITPDELDPTLNQEIDPDKEILIYARTSPNDGAWFNRRAIWRTCGLTSRTTRTWAVTACWRLR